MMNRGHIFIILQAVLFGISIPIVQVSVATIPVWLFTAMTFGIACIVMVPLARHVDGIKLTDIGRKNMVGILMSSLLGVVLYTLFLLYGLKYSSAVSVAVINSLTPAVTLILSFFILRESLIWQKVLAIGFAVASVLVMNVNGASSHGGNIIGLLLMILAVVCVSLFFIYANRFSVELPPFTLTAGLFTISFIITLPIGIYQAFSFNWSVMNFSLWAQVFYYGIGAILLPYLLTYIGITQVPASFAGISMAVVPVASTLVAVLFYHTALKVADVLALILVIISIVVSEARRKAIQTQTEVLEK
ncbi:MAG: DMT family transporter [Liquorilactobacillus satsumensis]